MNGPEMDTVWREAPGYELRKDKSHVGQNSTLRACLFGHKLPNDAPGTLAEAPCFCDLMVHVFAATGAFFWSVPLRSSPWLGATAACPRSERSSR